jgi:hypothetical protein
MNDRAAKVRIIKDLNNHYRNKMVSHAEDFAEIALHEIDIDDVTAIIVRNLIGYAAFVSIKYGCSKEEFLETCSLVFSEMMKGKERAAMQ